jgi:methyl-accepting chemotaxis protein
MARLLGNLRVRTRLIGGFAAVSLLLGVVGLIAISALRGLDAQTGDMADRGTTPLELISEYVGLVEQNRALAAEHLYVLDGDLAAQDATARTIASNTTRVAEIGERLQALPLSAEVVETMTAARGVRAAYTKAVDRAIALSRRETVTGDDARAASRTLYTATVTQLAGRLAQKVDALRTAIVAEAEDEAHESSSMASTATALVLIVGGVALALAVALSILIANSITRPLGALERQLADIADGDGDLTARLDDAGRDELGAVGRAFNRFAGQVQEIVRQVADSASALRSTSAEMARASEETGRAMAEIASTVEGVARGSSHQAEGTGSVSKRVEQISSGAASTAEAAEHAAAGAAEADARAADGVESAGAAVSAMEEVAAGTGQVDEAIERLATRSGEIGQIVGTITEIADQTNLLALNAAIEAARAGEQGRGFAVVADEVRKLAEEAQLAAGSIASLVGEIRTDTQAAVRAMDQGRAAVAAGQERAALAGQAFAVIRDQITEVSGQIGQVAAASGELVAAVGEIQDAVTGVASVSEENAAAAQEVAASTEQTTASVQEVSASASEVNRAAGTLADLVGRFRY